MSKRPNKTASVARKLDALARSESLIQERLLAIKHDVTALANALDRITAVPQRRQSIHAGARALSDDVIALSHFRKGLTS